MYTNYILSYTNASLHKKENLTFFGQINISNSIHILKSIPLFQSYYAKNCLVFSELAEK